MISCEINIRYVLIVDQKYCSLISDILKHVDNYFVDYLSAGNVEV